MKHVPCKDGESNSGVIHDWVNTMPGDTFPERRLYAQDLVIANISDADPGSERWHHWMTVQMWIGESMRLDGRTFIGDLLTSAPAPKPVTTAQQLAETP